MKRMKFITIMGIIGAGKTTLAELLSKRLNLDIYYEPVENNPYLPLFYQDKERYSFQLQIYFLLERLKQHRKLSETGGIQDRSIYEDSFFCDMLKDDGLLSGIDYDTYINLFRYLETDIKTPDCIIFLDVSPEKALERIRLRNRSYEKSITLDYLTKLHKCYQKNLENFRGKIIRIPYDKFLDLDIILDHIVQSIQ